MLMELTLAAVAVICLASLLVYNTVVSYRWHRNNRGEEYIRESSNWHHAFIYFNSDDPRLIVPKRTGGGYTFNFGRPTSWLLIVMGLILVIVFILTI